MRGLLLLALVVYGVLGDVVFTPNGTLVAFEWVVSKRIRLLPSGDVGMASSGDGFRVVLKVHSIVYSAEYPSDNTTLVPFVEKLFHYGPKVGALEDGNYTVVWQDEHGVKQRVGRTVNHLCTPCRGVRKVDVEKVGFGHVALYDDADHTVRVYYRGVLLGTPINFSNVPDGHGVAIGAPTPSSPMLWVGDAVYTYSALTERWEEQTGFWGNGAVGEVRIARIDGYLVAARHTGSTYGGRLVPLQGRDREGTSFAVPREVRAGESFDVLPLGGVRFVLLWYSKEAPVRYHIFNGSTPEGSVRSLDPSPYPAVATTVADSLVVLDVAGGKLIARFYTLSPLSTPEAPPALPVWTVSALAVAAWVVGVVAGVAVCRLVPRREGRPADLEVVASARGPTVMLQGSTHEETSSTWQTDVFVPYSTEVSSSALATTEGSTAPLSSCYEFLFAAMMWERNDTFG